MTETQKPWLNVVGIGEDGWNGLSQAARDVLQDAEIVIGGDRHHALAPHLKCERIHWPSPFHTLIDEIGAMRPKRVVVLVTGDPLWFSAGAYIARKFAGEVQVHPQISAFQLAAARMGWSLADVETLTIHGRPAEQIIPYFQDDARMLVLTQNASSPETVARLLVDRGFGPSRITVLGALGGPNEVRIEGRADNWDAKSPGFHVLAVEVVAATGSDPHPLIGLPDDAYVHDGQITKRELRVLTVGSLSPRRGSILWDIGAGSGSVGIEFMRAGRDAMTYAVENNPDRAKAIHENAKTLGTPRLKVIETSAPDGLQNLPAPDAIFIGGGLSKTVFDACLKSLKPKGRIVANAVTLESEMLLAELQKEHGGMLSRIGVSRAEPVGRLRGWRPMMPVTQWVFTQ